MSLVSVLALLSILLFFKVEGLKNKVPTEDSDKAGAEIIPSLSSRYSSSSPTGSSYYGYNTYPSSPLEPNPYRHSYAYNPLDPYERVGREYASASSNIGYAASAPDLIPAANGHGGGGSSHHGGGYGWGGGHHTKVSNSGLGLLGLLGLLSLLQGVLNAIARAQTTTAAPAPAAAAAASGPAANTVFNYRSKQKRSIEDADFGAGSLSARITHLVLPSLNVIAHARNGNVPLACAHHEVCLTNSVLIKELGTKGRLVGHQLSGAITRMLSQVDRGGDIGDMIDSAREAGQNGSNCHKAYPVCKEMRKSDGTKTYPTSMMSTHQINNLQYNPVQSFI